MKIATEFPLERIPIIQNNPQDYRLLERMPPQSGPINPRVGDEERIVFLDLETTGLDETQDTILELGVVAAEYSPSAKTLTQVTGAASLMNDPGRPIPQEITKLTGITDADVRGHRITPRDLDTWLYGDPLVVAHNAEFDRRFFDAFAPNFKLRWACSKEDIEWRGLGYEAQALSYLCLMNGFFYGGHRAQEDCLALTHLFRLEPAAFTQLVTNALEPRFVITARQAPFDVKDHLKGRGYTWPYWLPKHRQAWFKEIPERELDDEKRWLGDLFNYGERSPVEPTDPYQRFAKAKATAAR